MRENATDSQTMVLQPSDAGNTTRSVEAPALTRERAVKRQPSPGALSPTIVAHGRKVAKKSAGKTSITRYFAAQRFMAGNCDTSEVLNGKRPKADARLLEAVLSQTTSGRKCA